MTEEDLAGEVGWLRKQLVAAIEENAWLLAERERLAVQLGAVVERLEAVRERLHRERDADGSSRNGG